MMNMKTRKPWVAAKFSLFFPGLGQLYNGNLRWAIGALIIGTLITTISTLFLFEGFEKLVIALLLSLVVDIFFTVSAWKEAKRLGAVALKPFQRWWIYMGYGILLYGLPTGYGYIIPDRFLSFQIPSESMVPTLLVGDRLVADGWAYWKKDPQRGDIVVFDYPKDPSIKYVKRLIGLPGDEVELKQGELYVNKKLVEQTRTSEPNSSVGGRESVRYLEKLGDVEHIIQRMQPTMNLDFGPVTVPEGKFFVMGDNRDRSSDSRVWGFVDRSQLIGKMRYIYFSWNPEGFLRTDRIGKNVF
jgi:signal peptidase I